MEAVPRLSMISCDLKSSPNNTEFGTALLRYIKEHYHEDPETYKKEIKELETLRQSACKPPHDYTGCSILKRYYSQLHFLQSRFPMTDDGAACVPFTWTDIYSQMVFSITDIEYEQACILYNIGALHSELGAMDPRTNTEGMKIACTHLQCAAWAFQHLRDTYPQPKGSDMSHDLLTFFINVMLAQAQECILEKSMLDSRKSSITAKVAAQVVEYYRCALGVLVSGSPNSDSGCITDVVGSKMAKEWKKFIQFKMAYYKSISHLYMGNQAEEQQKMGERVAWYQCASEELNEAIKIAKSLDRSELNETLTFTMDVIGGKHSNSKKENDFVYHEKVPAIESLPELQRASLVKGIPFSHTDPDVCGQDIFARLVPMEAHESASLYSEEKAKILRSVCGKIEDKNQELTAYLSSLQVEKSDLNLEPEVVPEELIERCAAMSVCPTTVSDLSSVMKELMDTSKNVEDALKKCCDLLLEEEQKELIHQAACGTRMPSLIVVELIKECAKYQEAHVKAVESNQKLQSAVSHHVESLKLLSRPLEDIEKSLPSVSSMKSLPLHEKAVKEFQHLLDKVDEMRQQRDSLEQQLRNALQRDDITEILITQAKKSDLQKTFQQELKKHDHLLRYLDQNLEAQDNILCALTTANAQYAETRKAVTEIKKQREIMIQSIINSFDVYEDIKQKTERGLEFYQKLHLNVTRLLARIRSVTHVQDDERNQIVEAQSKKGGVPTKMKSLTPDTPTPKLKDYLPTLGTRSNDLPPNRINYPQMPTDPGQSQLYQPSVPISDICAEKMRFPLGKGEININSSVQNKYRNEISVADSAEFSTTGVRPPPVGSEATTVPEMCSEATSVPHRGVNISLPSKQYWNSVIPTNSRHATIYSPGLYAVAGTPQQASSKFDISQGFHSSSGTSTNKSAALVNSYVTSGSNQFLYDNKYHRAPFISSCGSSSVNASQVYSPSLSSYASPPVSPTDVSNLPYIQVTQGTVFAGYPYNTTSVPYMTSGIPTTSTFLSYASSTTPTSESCLYSYSSMSTPLKYMSYGTYSGVPVQGNLSATYSSFPSTQYSIASSTSNLITSTANYAYSMPSWTQMYPYSQQSGGIMPLSTTSYPHATEQNAESRSQWAQPNQVSNFSGEQNYVMSWSQTEQPTSYSIQPASPAASEIPVAVTDTAPFVGMPTTAPVDIEPIAPKEMEPISPKLTDKSHLSANVEPVAPKSVSQLHLEMATSRETVSPKSVSETQPSKKSRFSLSNSDLLCGTSETIPQVVDPNVLQPKIIDVSSKLISESKEKDKNGPSKDPLDDPVVREKFIAEVEKYEKFVDGLVRKSLNGTTPLDQKWKEFIDAQDKESRKMSISIARCYPLKNRYPDIMPYDNNRVKLSMMKDDYINASYLKDLFPSSAVFVNTQAPLPTTYADFWAMIWEQQVETLVCLLSSSELKSHFYLPKERGQSMQFGLLNVALQNQLEKMCSVEYRISLTHNENRISRVVVVLQFTGWPSSGVPSSPSQFLQFVMEVLNYHKQQRSLQRPVVVHCSAGVGRSGVFCLVSAMVTDLSSGHGPTDIIHVAARMSQQRKFLIQEKDQLKFCYDAVLYYAQDLLMKRGILTNRASFEDKLPGTGGTTSHSRHPSEDFILGSGGLAKLQSGMAKMGLSSDQQNDSDRSCDSCQSNEEQYSDVALISKNGDSSEAEDDEKLETGNICSNVLEVISTTSTDEHSVTENEQDTASNTTNPSITSLLDPSNFTLEAISSSPVKKRITKESFINPTGGLTNPVGDRADPLSQLDPLWSLKRNNT